MHGQILKLEDGVHQGAAALLPWLVNGSLEGDERAQVQQHVEDCVRCKREVEWLREVQYAYQAIDMAPDVMASFNKLRPRLDAPRGWSARSLWVAARRLLHETQGWARWTMAAQLALIVGLGVVTVAVNEGEKTYRVLGADPNPTRGSIVVAFDPATPEAQLRGIVRASGARIVSGPTQNDAYVLQLPAGQEEAALQSLRAQRVVVLAERLQAAEPK